MKKILSLILVAALALSFCIVAFAENGTKTEAENSYLNQTDLNVNAKSAILMEAETGTVLYSKNADEALPPASVTKIMTLILAAEALKNGHFSASDTVSVSEYAASKGGSQVFLEANEKISVEDLFKCTVIASANDAAVALAELVAGSEEAFVAQMNKKAAELGLKSTVFENATGLDDTVANHLTSAADIAKMSAELIKHDIILKYSSIWQDTIRDGAFVLTNTNRLVRYYDGCNGLKTGSTDKAGFCMSATAKRGEMQLIAVVMGADTRDIRNAEAKKMLDYGFSSYTLYKRPFEDIATAKVLGGVCSDVTLSTEEISFILPKGAEKSLEIKTDCPQTVKAPIATGDEVGYVEYILNGKTVAKTKIVAQNSSEKISFPLLYLRMITCVFIP